jgi:gluconokinase
MGYILGIDIGTSSSKAIAWSLKGKLLGIIQEHYPTLHPLPGRSEQNPDQILAAIIHLINKTVKQHGQPVCVSFSSAMHSIMAVGKSGQPLSPLIIWSDARSQQVADELKASKTGKKIYEHTGTPVHAMSPLCKLIWWHRERSAFTKKVVRFISIKEYVLQKLCGEYGLDYSLASATGLFDIRKLNWYIPALELAGIKKEQLSALVSPTQIIQTKKSSAVAGNALQNDTPLVIGGSDGCLANLGSGAIRPGEAAVTIGTSGAIRMFSHEPVTDKSQSLFCYLLTEKEYIIGGAVNNGGILLDWFGHFISKKNSPGKYNEFVKNAMKVAPGSDGLLFLPYLQGERSPMWDARARGAFVGINLQHRQEHFMRAVLEGIGFAIAGICQTLSNEVSTVRKIVASGGFTNANKWVQLMADIMGKKIIITDQADASCMGAVMMGGMAKGIWKNKEEAVDCLHINQTFYPDKQKVSVYKKQAAIYAGLYPSLKKSFHQLADLQIHST